MGIKSALVALIVCLFAPCAVSQADPPSDTVAPASVEAPPQEPAKTSQKALSRKEIVVGALRNNLGGADRFYVAPRIPQDIADNARQAARLAPSEELLGVADRTVARNGKAGLYFLADGLVQIRPPSGPTRIYYEQLANVTPRDGLYVLHYGNVMIDGQAIGKDRVKAIIAEILAGIAANPEP